MTEGGAAWRDEVNKIVKEIYPDKEITAYNAGKGGTGSDYGAARFAEDVAKYSPDLVVVDFAVNDGDKNETNAKVYMDSIVQQCLSLPKIPAVIFLNAPFPEADKTSEKAVKAQQVVAWKNEVADYYGITKVNVYDYMLSDYEANKATAGYADFGAYLTACGYNMETKDVHAGYAKYAEAIRAVYEQNRSKFLSVPTKKAAFLNDERTAYRYSYILANSQHIEYTGDWTLYTNDNKFNSTASDELIPDRHYLYPYFLNGVMQTKANGTEFTFKTTAAAFTMNHIASKMGRDADVFIDGKKSATITCYSEWGRMNYISSWVTLPKDGQEHTVTIKVNDATADKTVFRFGEIILRNN